MSGSARVDTLAGTVSQGPPEAITAALAPANGDLVTLGAAYRRWALGNPRLYEPTTRRRLARDRLPDGLEAAAAAPLLATGGNQDLAWVL
ncbi:hypothetical protein [Pseudonocardia sp. H11422]|uniref:hypothetical protein n=1 Tax=Pseudonocardia sp. H11422 TaxID=2835866 RepID=UPI001BDBBA32|nr:hypothetical protein [Pseudonocardia sp. H11422]